jgi:hypothetical protein
MPLTDEEIRNLSRTAESRIDFWATFITRARIRSVLEIGVWKGQFAREVLQRCPCVSSYTMLDPWRHLDRWNKPFNVDPGAFDAVRAEALDATSFAANRRTILQGTTLEVIDRVPDGSIDLVYVDGDHTLRGIAIDLIKALPKVSPNGFLAGDDFVGDLDQHGKAFEPSFVYPFAAHFAEAQGLPFYGLPFAQFLIPLEARAGYRFHDLAECDRSLTVRSLLDHPAR